MSKKVRIAVNEDQSLITIDIPIEFQKRGGKKTIINPDGHSINRDRNDKHDIVLIRNLVQAHYWQRMITSGKYGSINQLCDGENLPKGNIVTVIRMVTLAPDIQHAILNSTHPSHLTRADFVKPFPHLWKEQRKYFGFSLRATDHH